jgi:hypothetical protein
MPPQQCTAVEAWITAAVLGLGALGCGVWRESQNTAMLSCLSSVHATLESMDERQLLPSTKPGRAWVALSDSDTDRIIAAAARVRSLDCRTLKQNQPLLDYWDGRVRIEVRSIPPSKLDFRVSSNGVDGEAGTADDLVSSPE